MVKRKEEEMNKKTGDLTVSGANLESAQPSRGWWGWRAEQPARAGG